MFLKHKPSQDLVEILDITSLVNPLLSTTEGRFHAGEELQEPATFNKSELLFPSDEPLPQCWIDPHYREHMK